MFWPKVDLESGMYPINLKKKESTDVDLRRSCYWPFEVGLKYDHSKK